MTSSFDHNKIEKKWKDRWLKANLFNTFSGEGDKTYLLFAFPYPSGSGLHVGHAESMTALDIMARYYRMRGRDVFFPVGWDSFGLPAENYAIKTGVAPQETTVSAIETFKRQIRDLGVSFSWDHEAATSDPKYYRWTQWLFLKLYEKGLAYKDTAYVNWCPSCQTVLANEQVIEGLCERCDNEVEQREMEQWFVRITDYAEKLLDGLDQVDWPKATEEQQRNWIGKKEGAKVMFKLRGIEGQEDDKHEVEVFTTRLDTVYGATFIAVSPEKAKMWIDVGWKANKEVQNYVSQAFHKTEEERRVGEKEKTGVDTGIRAVNPVSGDEVPVYVADYVLNEYGTGAVMGVPGHDLRDHEFATKFEIEVREVVGGESEDSVFTGDGVLVNSGSHTGLSSSKAREVIASEFDEVEESTEYRIRDWLISRQRYWGAPIPIVYDPQGNPHPVKEEHLPWMLPTDVEFKPEGESPLHGSKELGKRVEDLYGKGWTPEYDTMDTFVDSSWYYMRYLDPDSEELFPSDLSSWLPPDFYMIGPEHIVLHLLYSRFLAMFLESEGIVSFSEPFPKMRHQGIIMGPDGKRMSKSRGNVINPDDVIEEYGADTLRLYEMFMGPIDVNKPWDARGVVGSRRFIDRVYAFLINPQHSDGLSSSSRSTLHKTIKKVGEDIEQLKFNTAISSMMEMMNEIEGEMDKISLEEKKMVAKMISPFAPFMSEEVWESFGEGTSIHLQDWPLYDESQLVEDVVTIAVQVDGKFRDTIEFKREEAEDEGVVSQAALSRDTVKKWVKGDKYSVVFVPRRVINIVNE